MKSAKTFLAVLGALGLLLPTCLFGQGETTIPLQDGWKFMPGDTMDSVGAEFDDSSWKPFLVDRTWEEQGYEKLDGYAWYRIKVVIPSGLKDAAHLQDGLRIFLGKINNFDQTFLNGQVIGINGKSVPSATILDDSFTRADMNLYNLERLYILPVDDRRIFWDQENVIAVRVFDEGGMGGLYTGDASLRMVRISDYLTSDLDSRPFIFEPGSVSKTFMLRNISDRHEINGTFTMFILNKLTQEEIGQATQEVALSPFEAREFTVSLAETDQSSLIRCEFAFAAADEVWRAQEESPYILTPRPDIYPQINGPLVYGARAGSPFLFTVPASGARPMVFEALNLPEGLTIDGSTGLITGRVDREGEYTVTLIARNDKAEDRRFLRIVIGDRIALTPPMGWNSWNCWGTSVDEDKVYASARAFRDQGLIDHGWSYVNIDDGWEVRGDSPEPKRDSKGNILTNPKFKDMKALADRVHALGLKLGLYSSPGPLTCAGYTGSYEFEQNDADSWAAWGIDYIKYDWCSYERTAKDSSREELMKPYLLMRQCLDETGRDIVFSLCQYGMGKVWEWGNEVGGNLWRTTGDITDTWESVRDIGFNQVENAPFAGPGRWNDPDMLVVGWVGWGPNLHPSRLTPDEQYTHISLWCLLAAPLLIGCDLERLDDFTINLLTNDEVLAVDQDPLGKQAVPMVRTRSIQVWAKDLQDGSKAVGLFNLGEDSERYTLRLSDIGRDGPVLVRDLWRQRDLGESGESFEAHIPSHGVVLVKMTKR